jgi:hypothetical protein
MARVPAGITSYPRTTARNPTSKQHWLRNQNPCPLFIPLVPFQQFLRFTEKVLFNMRVNKN